MKGLMKYGINYKEVDIIKVTKTKIVVNYKNFLNELEQIIFKRTEYGNVTFYPNSTRIKEVLFVK